MRLRAALSSERTLAGLASISTIMDLYVSPAVNGCAEWATRASTGSTRLHTNNLFMIITRPHPVCRRWAINPNEQAPD